jgi:hypothetical protein
MKPLVQILHIISEEEARAIFCNIEELYELHKGGAHLDTHERAPQGTGIWLTVDRLILSLCSTRGSC